MLPSEFYNRYKSKRKPYETRAEKFAEMTIPYAIMKDGVNESTPTVFKRSQAYCGGLVTQLKSKIGLALLPASTSSFRYVINPRDLDTLTGGNSQANDDIHSQLSDAQDKINKEIEAQQIRSSLFEAIEQMLIVGSVVLEKIPNNGMIVHTLKSFAVKLDRKGKALGICVVEKLYNLPDGITPKEEKDEYELYTLAYFDKDIDKWIVTQEVDGVLVGSEQTFKTDMDLPFRYMGWTWVSGNKYHRPYVEKHFEAMEQLSNLGEILTRGALASAKITWLVNERGGRTDKNEIANSPTGSYLHGDVNDVGAIQAGKNYDFQIPMEREQALKRELSKHFLSNESATRDSERTTAYEVSLMAQELESSTLGGIYTSTALDFSLWNVYQIQKELKVDFKAIDVKILVGLDALGRSQEAKSMDNFIQRLGMLQQTHYLKMNEVIRRYASYDGINPIGLVKTQQEVEQEQKQQQQQMAQQQGAEALMQSAGQSAGGQVAQPNKQ